MIMDFGQRGVILRLGEVRRLIRKTYIHSSQKNLMEARERTAKEIYMRYGCSTRGRWREGDYDEYKSHGISEEQESEWRKEYQKDLLDRLEREPCNGGFVTSAYMHCATRREQEILDPLIDTLDNKQSEMDSFSKMICAKTILDFLRNEGIKRDRRERLRSLLIDHHQRVNREPGNIYKQFS